ncbi:MAG: hypothetical protein PHF67_00490 [Candidatus Nanoarchaeia archaeon]|nr:hypothetical protein [Candidatus Nanoarchaeia archaeon]
MSELFTTDELDLGAFQAGIFFSRASTLSPVAIYEEMEFQSLRWLLDKKNSELQQYVSCAGVAGVAQYSLLRGTPAGVLARHDVHLRNPTLGEMQADSREWGDQVLGPIVAEASEADRRQYANAPQFSVLGTPVYYSGPARIVKHVFTSRVFQGEIPGDITGLFGEVDSLATMGDTIVPQGYQFLHATDGVIKYWAGEKLEDFDTSRMRTFGTVELGKNRMTFYAGETRDHPIDFSSNIYRE